MSDASVPTPDPALEPVPESTPEPEAPQPAPEPVVNDAPTVEPEPQPEPEHVADGDATHVRLNSSPGSTFDHGVEGAPTVTPKGVDIPNALLAAVHEAARNAGVTLIVVATPEGAHQ